MKPDWVKLHLTQGTTLPSENNVFDKACTVATAYLIKNPEAVFKKMFRVLKPNGQAAITFPVRENFMRFKPVATEGFYLHELSYLEAAFANADFINCHTESNDRVKFGAHCILGENPDIT